MRVVILTESFLPDVNGVSNSVVRCADHLVEQGHDLLILAPQAEGMPADYRGAPVVPMAAVPMPGYAQVRIAATPRVLLARTLAGFSPDVVHLASPINVGYRGLLAARDLGLPTVAIYQTDVPSYAARYRLPALEPLLWQRVKLIHEAATLTLVPSTSSMNQLRQHGVGRLHHWGRGVDGRLFSPARRDDALRARLAPGRKIIGYLGRLAHEKQVADLRVLADLPGTQTVIVGDGPCRAELETQLPDAIFLGQLRGEELARTVASFDVFVTPGELETFGQTIQEALASGVPGVAPASGGPIDLVQPSHTGWLYAPGDLAAMRGHVADLLGDDRKRAAFSAAARAWVAPRTWDAVCARLVQYYRSAIASNREQLAHHLADPLGELLGWEGPRERVRDLGLDRRPRQRSIAS